MAQFITLYCNLKEELFMSTDLIKQTSSRGLQEIPANQLSEISGGLSIVIVQNNNGAGATGIGIGFSAFGYGFGIGVGVGPGGMGFAVDMV
jgi:hypothetical protein